MSKTDVDRWGERAPVGTAGAGPVSVEVDAEALERALALFTAANSLDLVPTFSRVFMADTGPLIHLTKNAHLYAVGKSSVADEALAGIGAGWSKYQLNVLGDYKHYGARWRPKDLPILASGHTAPSPVAMRMDEYILRFLSHVAAKDDVVALELPSPEALGDLVLAMGAGGIVSKGSQPGQTMSPSGQQESIVDRVGPFWSSDRVRGLLGEVTRQALGGRRQRHTILALPTSDSEFVYPVWQFARTEQGDVVVKEGLRKVLPLLADREPWAAALFLCTPLEHLDGLSPRDWVTEKRDPDVLVRYMQGASTHWGAE